MMDLFNMISSTVEDNPELKPVLERDMKDPSTLRIYCQVLLACIPSFMYPTWSHSARPDYQPNSHIVPVLSCLVPLFEALLAEVRGQSRHLRAIDYQMDCPFGCAEITYTLLSCARFSMHKMPLVAEAAHPRNSVPARFQQGDTSTRAAT